MIRSIVADAVLEQVRGQIEGLLRGGTRYQVEKIATLAVYIVVSFVTLVWVVSGNDADNELGASYGLETIKPLDRQIFFIENRSHDDWTDVRIVLNRNFLYKTDRVRAGQRLALQPEDFVYYYWIPRQWGRSDWEKLDKTPRHGEKGTEDVKPVDLVVRAREGRLDIDLTDAAK